MRSAVPQAVGALLQVLDVLVAVLLDALLRRCRAAPVRRCVGALAMLALARRSRPRAHVAVHLAGWSSGHWPAICGVAVHLGVVACAPPRRIRDGAPLFMAGAAGGAVMVAPPLTAAPGAAAAAGVETVWAPAVPAAATRARVSRVRLHGGASSCVVGSPATRGAERTFRRLHFLLCPHFATGVASAQLRSGETRGVRLHHRGRRLGRIGARQPAVGQQRQQGAGLRGRPGHAARARSRRRSSDSYSGTAYFDPRFHWTELKVHTQIVSHNNPHENRPPLRKYEQARVLGGGSSINGQMANRGAPTDYGEWVARGAEGWEWDKVLPYFKKVERDLDFTQRMARQGRPHPGAPHPGRALDQARATRSARPASSPA